MVRIDLLPDALVMSVGGVDRVLAFKSELRVPLQHIIRASVDAGPARQWWKGVRLPGTSLPGVLTAGSFYRHGQWTFWDVRDPEQTIVIELAHEHYAALVVEVEDPKGTVRMINAAVGRG